MFRKRIVIGFFCAFAVLSGCSEYGSIYLTGDSVSISAEVYLDNKLVGTMQKYVPNGETSNVGSTTSPAFSTPFTSLSVNAANGVHIVSIIGKDGKTLTTRVNLTGEAYLSVDFQKMKISHE